MKYLDRPFPCPAENLAGDEALLNWAEAGGGEVLRFWESREYFVVVGYANKVETEVNVPACSAKNVPIFRRCSGGGTVLQGPGCLNYALVLQITEDGPLRNISSANQFIMERHRAAIESVVRRPPSAVRVCGHTDLALVTCHPSPITPKKFSGNSQRRHKRALLFHGTFLLNFDLPLVDEFLRMPAKQPDYRENRGHVEFLANLNVSAVRLKHALGKVWNAAGALTDFPELEMRRLVAEKYSMAKWNFKS